VVCRRRAEGGVTVFDLATGQPCVVGAVRGEAGADSLVGDEGVVVHRLSGESVLGHLVGYELIRGRQEHYLVVCRRRAEGGVTVFDLATGQP
jgi:hypothetical protein